MQPFLMGGIAAKLSQIDAYTFFWADSLSANLMFCSSSTSGVADATTVQQ